MIESENLTNYIDLIKKLNKTEELILDIKNLINITPNDFELGSEIRKLIKTINIF